MRFQKNASGLYEFPVDIHGQRKSRTLKGLIDTGSTDCVCTYPVITTLQIRPINFKMVSTIDIEEGITKKRCLIYLPTIVFDGKSELVELIRVGSLPDEIGLLLGMSFLSKYNLKIEGDFLDITRP